MSTREEFEKRLHIAYLDEVTVYSFKDSIFHAVVSMNMKKDTYINNLEKDWAELRRKYDIPDGVCLHFTDIKALLNPQYFLRQPKERNADMERIFCDTGNKLIPDKLFDFTAIYWTLFIKITSLFKLPASDIRKRHYLRIKK